MELIETPVIKCLLFKVEEARHLDSRQKQVLSIALHYAKRVVTFPLASPNQQLSKPLPPLVLVHGGAGSGKSRVINSIYTMMTDTFKKAGDDPCCPYVVLSSFTGAASANIGGQTLHSLFGFKFGTTFLSMTERQRAQKRLLFRNLRCVIIDEISMVSADLLYNLDLRLREITMVDDVFGGVSVFVFGDLFQLQPVKARYVFEQPTNKEHALAHALRDLWKLFTVVNLEENHRQGEDKIYGDLLNRVRTGDHTEEDIALLQTRVVPKSTVSEGTAISSEQATSNKSTLGPNAEDSNHPDEHPRTPSPRHFYPDDFSSLQIPISAESSTPQQSLPEDFNTQDQHPRTPSPHHSSSLQTPLSAEHPTSTSKKLTLNPNALHIYGTNAKVNARNDAKLKEIGGELFKIKAKNASRTVKKFHLNSAGCIRNTPFQAELRIKVGCDIVLVHNINTLDGLTNGCRGVLVAVEKTGEAIKRLVIKFNNPEHGRLQREKNPCHRHPQATYIDPIHWQYFLGGATATVFQFPVRGAAAITAHKIQVFNFDNKT